MKNQNPVFKSESKFLNSRIKSCIRYLLLHKKITPKLALSHNFCGLGIWGWCSWVVLSHCSSWIRLLAGSWLRLEGQLGESLMSVGKGLTPLLLFPESPCSSWSGCFSRAAWMSSWRSMWLPPEWSGPRKRKK